MPDFDDDRVTCNERFHCWPKFKKTARCENHYRAGLPSPWMTLGFTELKQRCHGFKPTHATAQAQPPAPAPKTDSPDRTQDRAHPNFNASKD